MTGPVTGVLLVLFFGMSALFSGLETGGYLLNRVRVRYRARRGSLSARRLHSLLKDVNRFVFCVLIANNAANYLLSWSVTRLYTRTLSAGKGESFFGVIAWNPETAAALTLMLPLFFFGELVPKNLFRQHADRLMYRFSGILTVTDFILRPVTSGLHALFRRMTRKKGESDLYDGFSLSLQGFKNYSVDSSGKRALNHHQQEMIGHLTSLQTMTARDLMRPILSEKSLDEKASVSEGLDLMRRTQAKELIVFRDSVRCSTGRIRLADCMDPAVDPEKPVKQYSQNLIHIPDSLPLNGAVSRLKKSSASAAFVTDPSAQTVGLLYLRDLARYVVSGRKNRAANKRDVADSRSA